MVRRPSRLDLVCAPFALWNRFNFAWGIIHAEVYDQEIGMGSAHSALGYVPRLYRFAFGN
jgi:hypothetical protein